MNNNKIYDFQLYRQQEIVNQPLYDLRVVKLVVATKDTDKMYTVHQYTKPIYLQYVTKIIQNMHNYC